MHASRSSAIDEILSKTEEPEAYEPVGRPGRKPGVSRPAVKAPARDRQAWRAIEDMKESRRLDHTLKEIYEDD